MSSLQCRFNQFLLFWVKHVNYRQVFLVVNHEMLQKFVIYIHQYCWGHYLHTPRVRPTAASAWCVSSFSSPRVKWAEMDHRTFIKQLLLICEWPLLQDAGPTQHHSWLQCLWMCAEAKPPRRGKPDTGLSRGTPFKDRQQVWVVGLQLTPFCLISLSFFSSTSF